MAITKTYNRMFEDAKKNRIWLERNKNRLLKKYHEEFVVICDQGVISHARALKRAMANIPEEYRDKPRRVEYLTKEKLKLIL